MARNACSASLSAMATNNNAPYVALNAAYACTCLLAYSPVSYGMLAKTVQQAAAVLAASTTTHWHAA